MTDDPIVLDVIASIEARAESGMEHYGQTMAENPLPAEQWAVEARHEAQDLALYLRRLETSCAALEAENARLKALTAGAFTPPNRRTSFNEDLVVSDEFNSVELTLSWSVDLATGRAYEFFVVRAGTGKPGLMQQALDEMSRRISKIIQGRY
jgi:hypothetical protein|tara:strand:+ start:107 stop:562 length:456 start_codon:yes stop_codon:yes gene_type:complete